ncbi:hypothetical protein [Sphingomonas aracearum]|uniref:Uncharacterized protein n=1 Tax=Sphingomonas aracearum TaxID=2283317 RepID=A0A369VXE7_9SPHN|nr:hypothetical protein [Sphingomonas aracearum]RDE05830.1 hypothetical protein DVW87_11600 [Sphingomonas aracearum]
MATTKKRTTKSPARKTTKGKAATQDAARTRGLVWGGVALGAITVAVGAGLALLARRERTSGGEHPVPDLAADAPDPGRSGARAPVDFRPDPTAVPDKSEYDSLRPATGPAPTLSATRGEMANQTGIGG